MLLNRGESSVDSDLKLRCVTQVLDDLLLVVGLENHANDSACLSLVDFSNSWVKVLTQELLLGFCGAKSGKRFGSDRSRLGLLLSGNRHRHGLSCGRLASECWESRLVNSDTLRLSSCSCWVEGA